MSNIGQSNIQDTRKTPPASLTNLSAATRTIQMRKDSFARLLSKPNKTREEEKEDENSKKRKASKKKYKNSEKGLEKARDYENSPRRKAVRQKVKEKLEQEKRDQPFIAVSDKTIISTCGNKIHNITTHPANITYNEEIDNAYSDYKKLTDNKEKNIFVHKLITTIEGMGLIFIGYPTLNKTSGIYEGRKLTTHEKYKKIYNAFLLLSKKQSPNIATIPQDTDDNGGGKMPPNNTH